MEMTNERWVYTRTYLGEVFGREDERFAAIRRAAEEAGLPPIAISADVGRLLQFLVRTTPAQVAVEIGTLGGYSTAWIADALGPGARLFTLDRSEHAASTATTALAAAGADDCVEVLVGDALELLAELVPTLDRIDFAFLDADKVQYPDYLAAIRPKLAVGSLVVADNVLGSSAWWIDQEGDPTRDAVDRFNRSLAADPSFDVVGLSQREGLLVARRIA